MHNTESIVTEYVKSKRGLSTRTKEEYSQDISLLLRYLGNVDLADITYEHIEAFLDSRKCSPTLANRRLSAFNSFFKYLMKKKIVTGNPVPLVEREKVTERLPRTLDEKKLNKVREACHNLISRTVIELLYNTGIRFSELQSCDIGDLNLKDEELRVLGKGDRERFVPISASVVPLLLDYLEWRDRVVRHDEQALFVTPTRGKRISKSWLSGLMSSLREESGVTIFKAHVLRHTFATDAINRGARRESVQQMLGHRKPSTTDIYIHITPDVKEDHRRAFP